MTGVDPDVVLSDHNYLLSLDIVFMKKTSILNNFLFMTVGFFSQFIQKIKEKMESHIQLLCKHNTYFEGEKQIIFHGLIT